MKTRMASLCAALTIATSLSSVAVAQDGTRDFKTALEECFWGLILTREDQRGLSLGLNVVSGALGSYAYTSATASGDTFCSEKTASTASFINDTYPALIEDTARGEGSALAAVLELAGCDAQAQAQMITVLREDVAVALSAPGYAQSRYIDKVHNLYQSVNTNAAEICKVG